MDKLKAWFKHSMTILWARLVGVAGLVFAVVPNLFSDPSVKDAFQAVLRPEYIPYYIIVIGVVTELARRRTAGQ